MVAKKTSLNPGESNSTPVGKLFPWLLWEHLSGRCPGIQSEHLLINRRLFLRQIAIRWTIQSLPLTGCFFSRRKKILVLEALCKNDNRFCRHKSTQRPVYKTKKCLFLFFFFQLKEHIKDVPSSLFTEQKQTLRLWKPYGYQRGQLARGRRDWGFGMGICTLRSMEQGASGDPLCSTENSTRYSAIGTQYNGSVHM